jgi:nitrate/nitrite-specific signal transduction histidine kinase
MQYRLMEDDMAYENTPAQFAEHVHKVLLQDLGKTSDWPALRQQTRHKDHLRLAREIHHTRFLQLFQGLSQRLSQELFQGLFQGLFRGMPLTFLSPAMQLCLVDAPFPADPPAKPILHRPLALIRKAFHKVCHRGRGPLALRRPALSSGSLEKALHDVCDDFSPSDQTPLRIVRIVILGETRPLPPAVHDQVYWIAREALLNALRHSAASRVALEIEYWERKLRVVVRDDGAGIDPKTLRTGRNANRGLTSMQQRAASIGAKVRVLSKRGGGTEVEISLPIPRKTA